MPRVRLVASLALLFLCTASAKAFSQGRKLKPMPVTRMQVETGGSLSVDFFPLEGSPQILQAQGVGFLNLGKVSYAGSVQSRGVHVDRLTKAFDVSTSLGLRIGTINDTGQSVWLKAWLGSPVEPYRVYLDDVLLTEQPKSVESRVETGVLTRHTLRIRVPVSTSEEQSNLHATISLQVVRN